MSPVDQTGPGTLGRSSWEVHHHAVGLVRDHLGGEPAPEARLGYDLEVPGRGRTKVMARSHRSTHVNWFRVPDVDEGRFDQLVLVEIAEDDTSVVAAWALTPHEVRLHARRRRRYRSGRWLPTLGLRDDWKEAVEPLGALKRFDRAGGEQGSRGPPSARARTDLVGCQTGTSVRSRRVRQERSRDPAL